MKKIFFLAFFLGLIAPAITSAQDFTMASLFKAMPDSLMPYLSHNNRLDMIDFMEAKMKAEVTNELEGTSMMTFLSSDSLSLQPSDVLRVDMKMLSSSAPADSAHVFVQVWRSYVLNEKQAERIVDVYTSAWQHVSSQVEQSSLLRRDDDLLSKPRY